MSRMAVEADAAAALAEPLSPPAAPAGRRSRG